MRNPHEPDPVKGAAALARALADTVTPPDTIRLALIRIDFLADRAGSETTGNGRFDLSAPDSTVPPIDRAPHDSAFYAAHLEALKRYFHAQSYGRVVVEGQVWPRSRNGAYSVSDMADFGPWKFSREIYRDAVHMFRTMLFAADSQAVELNDPIPWDTFDRFMLVHAGSDFQSDLRGDSPLDIPSFTIGVADTDVVIFKPDSTNRPIDRAAVVPETANQDGFYGALNGVIAHENGHNLFGMSDLYNIATGYPVVGLWSLMDSGNLTGSPVGLPNGDEIFATGLLPPSVDPFQRFFTTDILHFAEPAFGETTMVQASERYPDMRRIYLTSDEYLLFENRAIAPGNVIELDQDSTSRVVLGPKSPDRYEYDALVPGPGLLVWHIDASVIPFETAFRMNPDFGFNSNPIRPGISVVEADGLADLGDPGSPSYFLGSPLDPYFRSNNPVLADSTVPPLKPHIGTHPHMRIDVLDDPGPVMRFAARRRWLLNGWPAAADFPPGGPLLLAVDADGDRDLEVCWAGGATDSPDSNALFALRKTGVGINDSTAVFARLDRRPRPLMAALATQDLGLPGQFVGPSYFAVSTYADGSDTSSAGGRVYLLDHHGAVLPGWPAALPSIVTTPPVIAGVFPNATVYVGAADGRVYAIALDGTVRAPGAAILGGIAGRLAVDAQPPGVTGRLVAAGSATGQVMVLHDNGQQMLPFGTGNPNLGGPGFEPEFLWIDFDGRGNPSAGSSTCSEGRTLIVHHADRLWALCADGTPLPGWGDVGDTLVTGIGAGDPDGDGYAEVLAQSVKSGVGFWNQSGKPSPGWPRPGTREPFRTESPALGVDVNGDRRTDVVAMNGSGILAAFDGRGGVPEGWPLATGAGATGSPVAADLDRNGRLEVIAPDRIVPDSLRSEISSRFGTLYAYTLPDAPVAPGGSPALIWPMAGGDPGRTATLPATLSPTAGAPTTGPLVQGSLKAYPNPARNRPVSLAYRLTEPADVEVRILDTSGHEVASFTRSGRRADNVEIWDPGRAPAGLYLAQVRFKGATSDHVETVLVGVLR